MQLPERFLRITQDLRGEAGRAWLAQLPAQLEYYAQCWSLTLGQPFPNLTYNYVAPARRADGRATVLKVCGPGEEYVREVAALTLYGGQGAVALLEHDDAAGVLLLERAEPGVSLVPRVARDDEAATRLAAEVMRALWRPAPAERPLPPFPSLTEWTRGLRRLRAHFGGGTGPLDAALVAEAERYLPMLLATTSREVVLHADLHYDNILSSDRAGWLAIDPKGVIGDPAYEPAPLMYNPPGIATHPDASRIFARRLDVLAETLELERERLRRWALVQAILSAWWNIEDLGRDWEPAMRSAAVLATLK